MPFYTDNNNIFKTNINLCLDIDLNYRLLDINTNNYKIINAKNLSIYYYNNTILTDYLHASGDTYVTASAELWTLPKNLYGYSGISPCWGDQPNTKYDNFDWIKKGNDKKAKVLDKPDYTYCANTYNLEVKNIKYSGAKVLRLGAVPYFLFKDMYDLDKRLDLTNITKNMISYITIINTYCSNNIYCIVDPFHSDNYNLCSINNPTLVQNIFYPDPSITKQNMTNKWEPLTPRQFINAWTIIVTKLKENIPSKYLKYLLLELCNEPGGVAKSSSDKIIKGCNSIIDCNISAGEGGLDKPHIDIFTSNKRCQDIYDNSYQIPTIKTIRQIIPNIPIIVATYNTWTSGEYTFGSNNPGDNWYAYNCGKNYCTHDNYTTACIPTYLTDDNKQYGCGLGMIFSLLNNLKLHNLVGQPYNNIILAIHQYANTDVIKNGQVQYIIDTYDRYLSPLHMKWFMTEGNFNNYNYHCNGGTKYGKKMKCTSCSSDSDCGLGGKCIINTDDCNVKISECYINYLENIKKSTSFLGYTLFLSYYNLTNNSPNNPNYRIFFYDDNSNLIKFGSFKLTGECPKINNIE